MKTTRRRFIEGSTAAGGAALVSGLLRGKREVLAAALAPEYPPGSGEWVPTTCWIGKQDCGMLARRIDGRVVNFEGHPAHPRNRGTLCAKGVAQIASVYDPNRVKMPLVRTNAKGISGQWRQASWDEALTLVADRIRDVRKRDPRLLLWQKGRSKSAELYDKAFVRASGATALHNGAFCADAAYRACEYTVGLHGGLHPDFRHTRYLLAWGWNMTNAGGNKLCWITWPRQLLDARARGMKVVVIDPRLRGAGPFGDLWLPIRPGTDLALALAFCHALIRQDTIDRDYLQRHTNAPFLVQADGRFLRIEGKEQVWDPETASPRAFDTPGVDAALEGTFAIRDRNVQPAFQKLKDHIARYTPEWVANVCDVPAEDIRRVARELGENALIGSTIIRDGIELPHRPVAAMLHHAAQQETGFQMSRAILTVMMLLGSIEAVGGQRVDFKWKLHENFDELDRITVEDPPYDVSLRNSKYFPINSNNSSIVAKSILDPEKYGVDYTPEVLITHMANPLVSFPSQPDTIEAYKRLKFVAVIDPWLSETADYFADVVLPAATIEKYEGPFDATDQYTDAVTLRVPPMEPLFQSRGEIDIYMDLCEKAGILFGEGGYLHEVNEALELQAPHALPLDEKPAVRDIFDRWAKARGIEQGVDWFEQHGVRVKGPVPAEEFYGYAQSPPFDGIRHRLYGESLLRYRKQMRAKGADEIYWRGYTALPTWRQPTMERSPREYDLYLISYKMSEHKNSRTTANPLLTEMAPRQRLDINPVAARSREIADGDEVWVESHNAVTGETRRVRVHTHYTEAVRPDTVGMPHHFGTWAHPNAKDRGPSPNALYFTGAGYVAESADQSFLVKVRVYKA